MDVMQILQEEYADYDRRERGAVKEWSWKALVAQGDDWTDEASEADFDTFTDELHTGERCLRCGIRSDFEECDDCFDARAYDYGAEADRAYAVKVGK